MRLPVTLAFAGLFALSLAAHADTYSLTFSSNLTGLTVGTGALSFAGPSPFNDYSGNYTAFALTDFAANIDGQFFNFDDAGRTGDVVFYYGTISDYDFTLDNGSAGVFTLSFNYFFSNPTPSDYGDIGSSYQDGNSYITPEPSSLYLLSTGMLGVAGVLRKRLSLQHV